jgi:hypothetical protein
MKAFLLLTGLLSSLFLNAQISKENSVPKEEPVLLLLKSDLAKNGIDPSTLPENISQEDLQKLLYFDFSIFRNFSSNQSVQILNGPLIQLYSIERLITAGHEFTESFLLSKRNVQTNQSNYEVIPLVNVGFGKSPALELH